MDFVIAAAATAHAPRLGGGGAAIEIPWLRIVGALLLCSAVAWAAVLWLRRGGRWAGARRPAAGIAVVESRRLNQFAEVSLVRVQGREYAILSSAQQQRVLSSLAVQDDAP
ncbi:MAG: hypothetical protein PGN21_10150 [Sphingomonas paucimobilis]